MCPPQEWYRSKAAAGAQGRWRDLSPRCLRNAGLTRGGGLPGVPQQLSCQTEKRDVSVRCDSGAGADSGIMENNIPPMPAKRALAVLDQPVPTDIGPPKRISKK